jgi:cell division protein FtsI (penicillin-binding protein 3)
MVLSLFVGRLVQLQAIDAKAYAATAVDARLQTVDLPAERGQITDVNGVLLARTVKAVNVTADQTEVVDPLAEAQALSPVVHVTIPRLVTALSGTSQFSYVAKGVSPAAWQQVLDLRLPGIFHESTTKRVYPSGRLAANVVGYVGYDGVGQGGIESQFQSLLAGTNGQRTFQASATGAEIPDRKSVV